MRLLIHLLINSIAVYVAARLLRGVTISGFGTAIVVAVVLGLVSAFLGPLLLLLTLPINILTLGLFTFVIVSVLVMITSALVPGFRVASFWWALAFGLTLSIINAVLQSLA